jgi:ATP-binding cassette, subfamily B, bacterial
LTKFENSPRARSLNPIAVFNLYRRLSSHLHSHRKSLALAGFCMAGATAAEILKPWPLKVIFDAILIPGHNHGWLLDRLSAIISDQNLLLLSMVGSILLLSVIGGAFGFGQSYLLSTIGQKVVTSIRMKLYSHIQRLSQNFHDERSSGDLMTRLTQDVQMMRELLVNSGMILVARGMVIVGSLAVMFVMDWKLALVALFVIPLLTIVSWHFGARIKIASRQLRRREGRLAQVMTENIAAIRVVQAYARESFEEERFADQSEAGSVATLKAALLEAHMERLVQFILALGTCGVVWYGVFRVQAGALTPGDLLVFTAYLTGLYKPIRKLSSVTGRMAKATVSGERILDILELKPDVGDKFGATPAHRLKGAIAFRNVSFSYLRGVQVLAQANFYIAPGETVALMSESGSGKSTIANLLLRFYDPTEGSVRMDGVDIRDFTLESLRRQVAVVLQDSVLFNSSIRDNIVYGKLDASDEDIFNAARAASAHDFILELPNGYDTLVGERGALLSGGQRQRISIARAFIRDARILILDEPLTGLDRENEQIVRDALAQLMQGRTSIIITHDPKTAQMASRTFTISGGRILEIEPSTKILDFAS